ncbi:MAG TPA: response regulator [Chitinophagaceae bacterium]|jgi:two-component system LytT family response regulator|nr:response regulator [Chitinophagaceae bacterium]
MNVLLIDDEPLARMVVREYLQARPEVQQIRECGDGFEGVKAIMTDPPDLVFLDVQMPKITGFEMLELIEQPPPVIFTTAFDEYAIRAFEANAVDYLLKPFSQERFDKAWARFLQQKTQQQEHPQTILQQEPNIPAQSERIVVRTGGKIRIIPVHEVHYLEASDDYVKVWTKEGAFLKNKTLGFFEKALDSELFVRTHRSYIIHVTEITRIEPYEKESHLAILKSGAQVPVSRSGYMKLKTVLGM